MNIFLLKYANKFIHKHKVETDSIKKAVEEIQNGKYDAHLGNGLYKQRISSHDKGKSGGYRIILIINNNVFVPYIYQKADQGNISNSDLAIFKKMAKDFSKFTENDIQKAVEHGVFIKIK